MRRPGRLIGAVIASGLLAGALTAPAAAEQLTPTGEGGMAQVADCAAHAKNLLVSIVVDESGSLSQTDPTNQRVDGINSAIDALADLRAKADGKLEVEANLRLFAEGSTSLASWVALDQANATQLKAVSSVELPKRNHGRYTDYRAALTGAQSALDKREAEVKVTGTSCKVILLFTDGALDVRGDQSSAFSDLCAPHGIVDGVRGDRISVIALALFHEPSKVTPAQREQLRAVAEGTGGGTPCGLAPVPSGSVVGAYLRADDAGALRRVFAGVGARFRGGSQSLSAQCPSGDCIDGVVRFHVDRGIAGFQLVVDSPDNTAQPVLTGPDGQQVPLSAATSSSPWGKVEVNQRAGLTTATATFDQVDGAQVGKWALTSLDSSGKPSPVAVDLYYRWGAQLVVSAPDNVVIGQKSPVTVTVEVAGHTAPPQWYKSLDVAFRVGDSAPQKLVADNDGAFVGSVTLPAGSVPSEIMLTASASAVSEPSGIALAPVSWSKVLPTRLRPSYPTFTPTRLALPTITSTRGASGTLTLHGAQGGATKACLHDGAQVTGPKQVGKIPVSADTRCVDIAVGQTRDWAFTVVPGVLADGDITGEIQLDLTGADPGDKASVTVPVTSSMIRPVDEPLRWSLVALFVALSLIVPLLLLAIGNWWIGRFRLTELTRAASIPVTVTPAGVQSRRSSPAGLIEADDFRPVGQGVARKRTFNAQGLTFAHALPWWPMGDPTASATASPGEIVISGIGQYTNAGGNRSPVVTALERCWVLVVDPAAVTESEAQGRIVFVNEDSGLREIIAARSEKLVGFGGWDAVWTKLRAAAGQRERAAHTGAARTGDPGKSAKTPVAPSVPDAPGEPPLDGPPTRMTFDDDDAEPPMPGRVPEPADDRGSIAVPRRSHWSRPAKHGSDPTPPKSPDSSAPEPPSSPGTPAQPPDDELPPPPIDF